MSNPCQTNGTETPQPRRTLHGEAVMNSHPPLDLRTGQHRRIHLITRRSQVQHTPARRGDTSVLGLRSLQIAHMNGSELGPLVLPESAGT